MHLFFSLQSLIWVKFIFRERIRKRFSFYETFFFCPMVFFTRSTWSGTKPELEIMPHILGLLRPFYAENALWARQRTLHHHL